MKLYLFFLLCSMPLLGMEEGKLTAQKLENHPKIISAKEAFKQNGWELEVGPRMINMRARKQMASFNFTILKESEIFEQIEKHYWFYLRCAGPLNLEKSLKRLCILHLAKRYQIEEEGIHELVEGLPKELKAIILRLQGTVL